MTLAKRAVDSTLKKILLHAGEIVASIILLVIICLPLVFVIPMWLQEFGLETPVSGLLVNPVVWFGIAGAIVVTMTIAIASGVLGYGYVRFMTKSRKRASETVEEEEAEVQEEPSEEKLPEPEAPEPESVEAEPTEATDEDTDVLDEGSEDVTDETDEV